MINTSTVNSIRQQRRDGFSISDIAKMNGVSCDTVYKYLARDDFSPRPPARRSAPSKRPVQARYPPMARGRRPELAQAAPHRQAHMVQAGRRARRRRQRVHRRPLRRRAEEAGPLPGRAVPRPGVGARPGPGRLRRGRFLRFRRPHPPGKQCLPGGCGTGLLLARIEEWG